MTCTRYFRSSQQVFRGCRHFGGKLARQIDPLQAKGVRQEISAVATELLYIDNAGLLKPLHEINDDFISIIG